jgi:hypothetical protein
MERNKVSSNPGTVGIFISHRKQDAPLAERLADDIRLAGHLVWLDEWNIRVGDSIVQSINEGLENSKFLILCYSECDVLSPWMSREWMSTLARQLNGIGVKLLPVRLSGGKPPAILSDIKYADLVKDWAQGVAELMRALR